MRILFCIFLYLFNVAYAENIDTDIAALLKANKSETYRAPAPESFIKAQKLFEQYFAGKNNAESEKLWADIGFVVSKYQANGESYFVISENAANKNGGGIYVIKEHIKSAPLLVQTPHQETDLHTGKMLLNIMAEGAIDAASWNTTKRYNADMGKAADSYFAAFTEAFAASFKDGKLVQLHGFEVDKRKEKSVDAAAIVSAGTKTPNAIATKAKECMSKIDYISGKTLLYPLDIKELGGTKNISGAILRKRGNNEFLHVEMRVDLRKKWADDAGLVKDLVSCIK